VSAATVIRVDTRQSRKRVDFRMLLEALARRDEDFHPLRPLAALELYRWMVSSVMAQDSHWRWPTRWGSSSLIANMGGAPGILNTYHPKPFRNDWRADLAARFAHALLDDGPMAEWRKVMGVTDRRYVPMLVDERADWRLGNALDKLFALVTSSRRLRVGINKYHPDARFLTAVYLHPRREGWEVRIEYGLDGSRWAIDDDHYGAAHAPTEQQENESLLDFVDRSYAKFDAVLTPPCAPKRWGCEAPSPFRATRWLEPPTERQCEASATIAPLRKHG
jgi:hypothetical protein